MRRAINGQSALHHSELSLIVSDWPDTSVVQVLAVRVYLPGMFPVSDNGSFKSVSRLLGE